MTREKTMFLILISYTDCFSFLLAGKGSSEEIFTLAPYVIINLRYCRFTRINVFVILFNWLLFDSFILKLMNASTSCNRTNLCGLWKLFLPTYIIRYIISNCINMLRVEDEKIHIY